MRNKFYANFTLRMKHELLNKVRYIASCEMRSTNKQIEQYVKRCVAKFEKENGEITVFDNDTNINI